MGYVRFGQVGKCMERQLIMGAIVASLKTRPVEDANADENLEKQREISGTDHHFILDLQSSLASTGQMSLFKKNIYI